MKKIFLTTISILFFSIAINAQSVKIGPRLTGNFNIYNQDGLTGTWNGLGIGIGGVVDISFNRTIGILTNLTFFDMKNFSNDINANNTSQETSLSLSYFSIDPLFKAEFNGFYLVGGPSIGIKLSSSGERVISAAGQTPNVTTLNIETNSIRFDIAAGTGYNFKLSRDLFLGTDFMVYIPITNTFDTPAISNSILSLKFGVSVKFKL